MRHLLAVVIGVAVGNAIYFALAFGVLQPIQQASGDSPEAWLGVAFFLLQPIGLFAGGILTGYLARTIREPIWLSAAIHAPGLYTFLGILVFNFHTVPSALEIMPTLLLGVVWVVISSSGVLLGKQWHRRSHFNIKFAQFLGRCHDVASFSKNYFAVHRKIDDWNVPGEGSDHYPDFIVRLSNEETFLVETQVQEDFDDTEKITRLRQWCDHVNGAQRDVQYRILYVKQEQWDRLDRPPSSFAEAVQLFAVAEGTASESGRIG